MAQSKKTPPPGKKQSAARKPSRSRKSKTYSEDTLKNSPKSAAEQSAKVRGRFNSLIIVIVVGVIGYSVLWQAVARRVKTEAVQHLRALANDDLDIAYSDIEMVGFPYRLVINIKGATLVSASGGVKAATANVNVISHLWTPNQWTLETDPVKAQLPFTDPFTIPRLEASWVRLGETGSRVVIDLVEGTGLSAINDRLTLGLLIPGAKEKEASDRLQEDMLAAITGRYNRFDRSATFASTLTGPLPYDFSRKALGSWRDAGGLLDVTRYSWTDPRGAVKGSASLALDQDFQLLGALNMQVTADSGRLPLIFSEFMADPQSSNTEIAVTLQNGRYFINGRALGTLVPFGSFLAGD